MNHLTQSLRRLVAAALVLLTMPAFAQLSGTYTINPAGTGTSNYASFSAAVTALTTSGVSGAVTFNVAQGTYTEQVTINAITGTSTTNKITFKAATTNTLPVNVTFAGATAATNNWTLRLNGVNNLEFDGIKFSNTTPAVGTALPFSCNVNLNGTTSNIAFLNCSFTGSNTLGSTNHAFFFETGSFQAGAWTFNNCQFINTSRGINLNANATNSLTALTVTGCTFNTLDRGLTATNGTSATVVGSTAAITNNTFAAPSTASGYFSVWLGGVATVTVTGNTLNNYSGVNVSAATAANVSNNSVTGGAYAQGISVSGLTATPVAATIQNNTLSANSSISVSTGLSALINQNASGNISVSSTNNGIAVTNNSITTTTSFSPGISLSSAAGTSVTNTGSVAQGFVITNNRISQAGSPSDGITVSGFNIATGAGIISNNTISATLGTSTYRGIYPYQCKNVNVYHNTVSMSGASPTAGRALYLNNLATGFAISGINVQNNIFINKGPGYAAEISTTAMLAAIGSLDNNVYFSTATNPFRFNAVNQTTLAGWQAATTKEIASVWGDILFYSPTDLHVQNAVPNNIGAPIAIVTTDMDGQSRSATSPDAGADEFTPLTCFSVNGITATNVSNSGFTASWTSTNSGGIGKQRRIRIAGTTAWSITTVPGPANSMTVTGLLASTQYEYQIRTICSAGDTSIWSSSQLVQTAGCPAVQQCTFNLNMTDSFGDGWNGALISVQQKKGTGPWITVATFGSSFTTGTTATGSTALCTGDSARVIATAPGSYSYEVGFTLVDANGVVLVTRLPGSSATGTFASGFVFGKFLANCPPPCPITAVPTIPSVASCGGVPVTLNASWSNPFHKVFWTGIDGRPNGIGASYTTPNIPAAGATVSAQLYTRNYNAAPVSGGPSIASFAAAGTAVGYSTAPGGNFSNGFGIDVAQPFTLDSATVRAFATTAGGKVKFVVRVFERKGPITAGTVTPAGRLIAVSDTITVTSTSTTGQNFRVPIGLDLVPGRYHIQLGYALTGNTGRLYRSTALPTGNSYPFAIGTLGSVDSVALAATGGIYSPTRVYYLFDLKATPGCTGPAVTVNVPYVNTTASIPYSENFNNGIPCNWINSSNTSQVWNSVATFGTNSLNGSQFAFFNDDAAGATAPAVNASLESPVMSTLGYDSLTLSFSHYYYHYAGTAGYVEVFNGTSWVAIDTFNTTQGSWTAPASATYNVTAQSNPNFKVRFRYSDGTGVYGWYWAVDNVSITGTPLPCTNVRVAITTDIYGSEVTWNIKDVNTGFVWATGGPYSDVTPYNAAAATHIDTLCLPLGNYEFQINDSYGDGLTDGTNTGTYLAQVLCAYGPKLIDQGSGALPNDPGGATANIASWDSATFDMDCRQPATYHVSVNMNQQTVSANGVHIAGNFQGWNPSATPMTDANGDGIYEYTISTFVGEKIEYKFINGNAWGSDETVPLACRYNNSWNRGDSISSVADSAATVCFALCYNCAAVTFQVDMNQVTQAFTTPEVNGLWNNWCGNCNAMTDANGDGIWSVTLPLPVGSTQEYKFSADSWTIQEQNDPTAPCTNGNATYTNRVFTIPAQDTTLGVVCWGSCYGCTVDVTLKVNMAWEVANNAVSANGVHVAGDFQGWNPSGTPMTDANNDGIYEVTVSIPANSSIQYKFINGNVWGQDEPVPGACAVTGTTNRGATFAYADSSMSPVCFGKCTDCMASIDEALSNVSLFPNPNRGQFQLARMDASTDVEVSVLDLQGKVLNVAKWSAGAESLGIDLSDVANGVYMVRLTSEEGSRTMRVSVQK